MNLIAKAKKEFEILEQQPDFQDLLIYPFKDQILSLVEAFGNSGQSGGSAPYYIGAITNAISKLLNHQPLSPLTGEDNEWDDMSAYGCSNTHWQNKRDSRVFKTTTGDCWAIDTVIWYDVDKDVYSSNGIIDGYTTTCVVTFPYSYPQNSTVIDVIKNAATGEYEVLEYDKPLLLEMKLIRA